MTKYNINPNNIEDYMENWRHKFPLQIDDKAGLDFQDDKTKAIARSSCIFEKNTKTRCVRLEITSFRGISCEAVHYYGKLIADGVAFQLIENPSITTSNWDAEKINPLYQWTYKFKLSRPLTEDEINSNPDRWECYAPGDFVDCFNTKEELIALAIECFKARFVGEWELWMVDETVIRNGTYQIEV